MSAVIEMLILVDRMQELQGKTSEMRRDEAEVCAM